jgi:hypothetical protein
VKYQVKITHKVSIEILEDSLLKLREEVKKKFHVEGIEEIEFNNEDIITTIAEMAITESSNGQIGDPDLDYDVKVELDSTQLKLIKD